jgi:urocanate hydratase
MAKSVKASEVTLAEFRKLVLQGIPDKLPKPAVFDTQLNHAPKRKEILTAEEKKLAIVNALRYFPKKHHSVLAKEFAEELAVYGRIYMHRFRPQYPIYARPISQFPAK